MKVIVLASGGMDSTVLLYELLAKGNEVAAVSFRYGSKHSNKEIEAAKYHTEKLAILHYVVELPFIAELFESSLLRDGIDIPEGHYADISMKSTVVPFRNGIMLSITAGLADSLGYDAIAIASHSGDHPIYPDCREEFNRSMAEAIECGTYGKIKLLSPFSKKTKGEIAVIGLELGVELDRTWSCYKGEETQCGKCGTCVERLEALEYAREICGFDKEGL